MSNENQVNEDQINNAEASAGTSVKTYSLKYVLGAAGLAALFGAAASWALTTVHISNPMDHPNDSIVSINHTILNSQGKGVTQENYDNLAMEADAAEAYMRNEASFNRGDNTYGVSMVPGYGLAGIESCELKISKALGFDKDGKPNSFESKPVLLTRSYLPCPK